MHFGNNPFAPKVDTEKNNLMIEGMEDVIKELVVKGDLDTNLPKDCEFCELSLVDDRKDIMRFINSYYFSNPEAKTTFDENVIDFITKTNEAQVFVVKFKGFIIALHIVEHLKVKYNDELINGTHIDFGIVHPKFRKTFLYNKFTAIIYIKVTERGDKIEFWHSQNKLSFPYYISKPMYGLGLTDRPLLSGYVKNKYISDVEDNLRLPTVEELRVLNQRNYKIHYIYSDDRLKSLIDHNMCLTDGESIVCYSILYSTYKGVTIKVAVINDTYKFNKNFYKQVFKRFAKEEVDSVHVVLTDQDDLISYFPFNKVCDSYYYMMNMFPKVKRNEIMLMFR